MHPINKVKYLIYVCIFLSCNLVYAQNNDTAKYKTDEIKVYSNKIITSEFDSPTKIQFIDSKTINNKNGETLSDILQLGGNIFIKSYGGNYSLNTISMNGLGAEQTLILLNGFKINSYQNNQIDLNTIGKDNIEKVEILNNGSSSIYGSEAIGGVINITTKNNFVNDLRANVKGEFGSYEQKKVYAGLSKRLKYFNINLNYSKESSLNNYEYYFNNGLERILKDRANSNYDFSNYSVNFNYSNKQNINLDFYSSYTDQLRNIPGIETGSEASNSIQLDRNWNSILSYESALPILSGSSTFKSQINFQNNLSNYSDRSLINSYYKNIVLSNTSQISFTKQNLEIVTGYEVSYAAIKSDEIEDNTGRVQPAVFLVSEINLNNIFRLFPSVRYDYVSDIKKNVLSGKFGLNIKPFPDYKLNIKAGIGNNFAAPTFNELYWKSLGNIDLKPESSVNADAGVIFNFSSFSENTIELTYTYISATDKIVWSPEANGLWTPKNIGKSASNVLLFDLNAGKKLSDNILLNMDLTYSFTKSIRKSKDYENDPAYGKQIFYIPEQLAKCNLSFNYKKSGINIFYTFTGKRFTNFENTNFLPAVDLFEGNIYQNFVINKVHSQIKIEVNNIFNADYQFISGYPEPLRNYKLVLSFGY